MKVRLLPLFLIGIWACTAVAQTPTDTTGKGNSTIATQHLGEVVIRTYTYFSPAARVTILSDGVTRNKSNTLTEVLQENTGIYLKNYGPGMLSTISFRGTGAEHTALVWNGITINYPMLGLADFSTIPVGGFSNVFLLHGSSSAYFGSSAIGGSVLLGSSLSFTSGDGFGERLTKTSATFEAGSYNRWFGSINNFTGTKKISSRTAAQWVYSGNDFKFQNPYKLGKPIERQVNSTLQQRAFMQDFDFVTGENSYGGIKFWYNYTDRQIPPTLTSANSAARQLDESIRVLGEWDTHKKGHFNAKAAYLYDYIGYADNYLTSNAKVSTSTIQANYDYHFANDITVKGGIEGQFFTADIDAYHGYKTQWRTSAVVMVRYEPQKRYSANAGYRQIFVQGFKTAAAPTFGLTYHMLKPNGARQVLAKATVSRSFRVPTLNEQFWIPGGNPNLQAEGGWNYEASIAAKLKKGNIKAEAEVTRFAMKINNWLQWQPTAFGFWQAQNLKQVLSRGAEVTASVGYEKSKFNIKLNGAYSLSVATNLKADATNQNTLGKDLIYIPRNNATAGLTIGYAGFSLFTNVQYTGMRYITADNMQFIDGYTIINARLAKQLKCNAITLTVWVQAYNLANTRYFNLAYRPMPLRNYRAGITIEFEKPLKSIHKNAK